MSVKSESMLRFRDYVVESVEFKSNFKFSGEEKDLEFDINSNYQFEGDKFILALDLEIFPNPEENDYPFNMKVSVIGLFDVKSEASEKEKIDFAEKNSIAILFPYLRSLVSVYTANSNIGTTILPPINVVKYLQDKKAKKRT